MPEFPILKGSRILLRLADNQDINAILRFYHHNAERLKPVEPKRPERYFTRAFWAKYIKRSQHMFLKKQAVNFWIFDGNAPTNLMGKVSLTNMRGFPLHACYLGYAIDEKHEGQGKMREALDLAIGFGFETMNLHRIMANYMPSNQASAVLLQRLGFEKEGYAKDYLMINGRWEDHILTALVNPNWHLSKTQ